MTRASFVGLIQPGFQREDFTIKTWRQVAAELIAVMIFVFIGAGSVVVAKAYYLQFQGQAPIPDPLFVTTIALAHGIAIAAMVAATANISGGHINPAVTFSAVITGKMKVSTGLLYVAGQLAGAVLGALLLKAVIAGPLEMGLGAHGIGSTLLIEDQMGDGAGAALLVEAILTFALVFVVFATAMDPRGPSTIAPLAIGFTILIDHFVGIPLTGASMNPARSFGPAIVANVWTDHWVYWIGPLVGGGVAGLLYEFFFMYRMEEDAPAVASGTGPAAGGSA
jgi:aquaporin TIP